MSYKTKLGKIAERYDELSGAKIEYRVDMYCHSGNYDEYVIVKEVNGKDTEILSLIENEAYKLADLIKN